MPVVGREHAVSNAGCSSLLLEAGKPKGRVHHRNATANVVIVSTKPKPVARKASFAARRGIACSEGPHDKVLLKNVLRL